MALSVKSIQSLESEVLRLDIAPWLGGKIISFYHKGINFELAAQPQNNLLSHPPPTNDFGPYAFGMDDAFPNVDEEWVCGQFYPSHGEIWSANMEVVTSPAKDRLQLRWTSSAFHYEYEKNLSLCHDTITLSWVITNRGSMPLPALWTWHGLLRYETDMRFSFPPESRAIVNTLSHSRLGPEGTRHSLVDKQELYTVPPPGSRDMRKFFLDGPVQEGTCEVFYPSQEMIVSLNWDAAKLPYLGVWITAGGLDGAYNCALEPSDGFYDSVTKAAEHQALPVLLPGQQKSFSLQIRLRTSKV